MYEVITLREVVQELKDQNTLNFLQNLPYKMKIEGAQNFIEK